MASDEQVMFNEVECVLRLWKQGFYDDTTAIEVVEAMYLELRGPNALMDEPEEPDCD